LALLRQLDCENGQGFLFSNPLEPSEVEKFIAESDLRNQLPIGPQRMERSLHSLVA